jgi:hypothetical protein
MRRPHQITLALLAVLSAASFSVQAEPPLALLAALPAREGLPELRGDPFFRERKEQHLSARRAPVPAAPAAAAAPPNPYRFAGEVRQPGATRRFLVRGNDIFEVNTGDVLGDGYRVEAVEQGQVVLTHMATGVRQTINAEAPAATLAPAVAAPAATAMPFNPTGVIVGGRGATIPPRLREG